VRRNVRIVLGKDGWFSLCVVDFERVVPYVWEKREDEDLGLIESVASCCHHLLEKGVLRFRDEVDEFSDYRPNKNVVVQNSFPPKWI
ncbi:hypothetical protein AVEN_73539-1, partial [Araneus ventricosus]